MKIFAIKENMKNNVGYLFYYEKTKEFYIELLDNISEWDVPLLLSSLYKKGIKTIDSYWSKAWISQRIVPSDRQNINQILRDNKLKTYDEFNLLMLANGRCEQDSFYLSQISEDELPKTIIKRFNYRIDNVMVLDDKSLILFFRNKSVKVFDMNNYIKENKKFEYLIKNHYLNKVKVLVDGYGVCWDSNFIISSSILYERSKEKKLNSDILNKYLRNNVLSTSDVMKELNCSRQYVSELVKSGKIKPIKSSDKNTLFLKSEVLKLSWN